MYNIKNSIKEMIEIAGKVDGEWGSAKTKGEEQKVILKLWRVIDIINDIKDDLIDKVSD